MEYGYIYLLPGALAVLGMAFLIVRELPGLWRSSSRFNSTEGWTPAAPGEFESLPATMAGLERGRQIIAPCLEPEERLEGFAFARFFPARPQDWGGRVAAGKDRVLVAVTSRRMLLFLLNSRPLVVASRCFLEYEDIRYLKPPGPGFMGTSGPLRFGLRTGAEYQLEFLGPVIHAEFLQQEQRLAAHLRGLAPRFASSPPADTGLRRSA